MVITQLPYVVGKSTESLGELAREFLEVRMEFELGEVEGIVIEKIARRNGGDKSKAYVDMVCSTVYDRDRIFSKSGKIPFKSPHGRIMAKYPCRMHWQNIHRNVSPGRFGHFEANDVNQ